MSDTEDLLRAVAGGDRAAFTALYRTQRRPLVAFAAGLLGGDTAAAEDVIDAAFMAIWQDAANWSGSGSARGWIRRIVRNKSVDWLRANGRYQQGLEPEDLAWQADPAESPEGQAIGRDAAARLRHALRALSLDQREAVMLCYFEDMPLAEIAAIAGCPEGTVKTRLYHARLKLRAALGERIADFAELQ